MYIHADMHEGMHVGIYCYTLYEQTVLIFHWIYRNLEMYSEKWVVNWKWINTCRRLIQKVTC